MLFGVPVCMVAGCWLLVVVCCLLSVLGPRCSVIDGCCLLCVVCRLLGAV